MVPDALVAVQDHQRLSKETAVPKAGFSRTLNGMGKMH
jgi:hypothetical protein